MKKPQKGLRKVSNPEIPVEVFYALGGITVLGIGFFVWRFSRVASSPIQLAIETATRAGGDCAEKASQLASQAGTAALGAGAQTNTFTSDFNLGSLPVQNTSVVPTPPAPTTTTPESATTPSTTIPPPTNTTPAPTPPVVIQDALRDHLLSLVPNSVTTLTARRNGYETTLTHDQVVRIQNLMKDWHNRNMPNAVRVDSSFSDGSIGRLTRALIYRIRTDTAFARAHNRLVDSDPNNRVYLYPEFENELRRVMGLAPVGPAGHSSVNHGSNLQQQSEAWRGTSNDSQDFSQRYSNTSQETTDPIFTPNITGSGVRAAGQGHQETFYSPPNVADNQPGVHTSSDPSGIRLSPSTGMKVKTKKRKL